MRVLDLDELKRKLNVDKTSELWEVRESSNAPPPPPNSAIPPPLPPKVEKPNPISFTPTRFVNDELMRRVGSKWLRGRYINSVLDMLFRGELGGQSNESLFTKVKKKFKKSRSHKSAKKVDGVSFDKNIAEMTGELQENPLFKKMKELNNS